MRMKGTRGEAANHSLLIRHPRESGDPAVLVGATMTKGGWVYMMTERYRGTIYTGVTAYLPERISLHRAGKGGAFTSKYGLRRFVYCENFDRIEDAIAREKAIKKWRRAWKIELIETMNPDWNDLYDKLIEL